MTQTKDLEDKWFYRFVKVMYIFSLAIVSILFVIMCWNPPREIIDNDKSYFVCPDGSQHSFHSLGMQFYSENSFNLDTDVKKAIQECNKNLKKGEPLTDKTAIKWLDAYKHWDSMESPYPTRWIYETVGSWLSVVQLMFFGLTIIFLIINILKQAILYIVYGKKINIGF